MAIRAMRMGLGFICLAAMLCGMSLPLAEGRSSGPVPVGDIVGEVIGADGKPAAKVYVRRALDGPPQVTMTDENGRFVLKNTRAGSAVMYATNWDDSKPQATPAAGHLEMGVATAAVIVRPEQPVTLPDRIQLVATVKVVGKVIAPDGEAAANTRDQFNQTRVRYTFPLAKGEGVFYSVEITTNDKGEFTFPAVPIAGREVTVDAFMGLRTRGIHGSKTLNPSPDKAGQTVDLGEVKLDPRPPDNRGRSSRSGRG